MIHVMQQSIADRPEDDEIDLPDAFCDGLGRLIMICNTEIGPVLETEKARLWLKRTKRFIGYMMVNAYDGYDSRNGRLHQLYCKFIRAQKSVGVY